MNKIFNPQSFNGPALRSILQIIQSPTLIIPSLSIQDINHLNLTDLHKIGIKGVILDKDNTITAPYSLQIHPRVKNALLRLQSSFPNHAILSNSAGTPDDIHFNEAIEIEKNLGIRVIRHLEKKPSGLQETLNHFQLEKHELAVVGDRLLTDVVFGNLHGMYTIHVQILTLENDNPLAKVARAIENTFLLPFVSKWFIDRREGRR